MRIFECGDGGNYMHQIEYTDRLVEFALKIHLK